MSDCKNSDHGRAWGDPGGEGKADKGGLRIVAEVWLPVVLVTLVTLVTLVVFAGTVSAEADATLLREWDPIIVSADLCGDMAGEPLDRYRLLAVKEGRLSPIPFQIEEVDEKGQVVLTHGRGKGTDDRPGSFEGKDQLVFMARDTGQKSPGNQALPAGAVKGRELEVSDPVTGNKAWVYLVVFDKPSLCSPVDYVSYDPDNLRITAQNYIAQFNPRFPVASSFYAFRKTIGGDEENILDRVKVRINMKLIISLNRTEKNIGVKEVGYVDGPVRVLVRQVITMKLPLGIPASRTTGDSFYYYGYANFPFAVYLPFKPTEFRAKVYDDFKDLTGWRFYSSTNPVGHGINGTRDEEEGAIDRSPWTWSCVTNGKLSFWSKLLTPPESPVRAFLYFNDDRSALDPAEEIPGEVPGIGWDFKEGWSEVEEYPLEHRLVHFFTRGYSPGDEKAIMAVHDQPLQVRAGPAL